LVIKEAYRRRAERPKICQEGKRMSEFLFLDIEKNTPFMREVERQGQQCGRSKEKNEIGSILREI
jgi:hypothetical protein